MNAGVPELNRFFFICCIMNIESVHDLPFSNELLSVLNEDMYSNSTLIRYLSQARIKADGQKLVLYPSYHNFSSKKKMFVCGLNDKI